MAQAEMIEPTTGEILPVLPWTLRPAMPPTIAAAIVAVMKDVRMLGVDEKNPHGGYAYVSVDKFYDIIGRKMAEKGIALMMDEVDADVREGSSGKPWLFSRYSMSFIHESGAVSEPVRRSCALPISGPQAFGAAQSYIEKQFLRQVFKIPTGEKDADETAPDENAAPPRSRGRTAQEAPQATPVASAPKQYPQRPAAAAPSDVKTAAIRRHREVLELIESAENVLEIDELTGGDDSSMASALWKEMCSAIHTADPGERGDNVIAKLRQRAEDHKRMLLGVPQAYEV